MAFKGLFCKSDLVIFLTLRQFMGYQLILHNLFPASIKIMEIFVSEQVSACPNKHILFFGLALIQRRTAFLSIVGWHPRRYLSFSSSLPFFYLESQLFSVEYEITSPYFDFHILRHDSFFECPSSISYLNWTPIL